MLSTRNSICFVISIAAIVVFWTPASISASYIVTRTYPNANCDGSSGRVTSSAYRNDTCSIGFKTYCTGTRVAAFSCQADCSSCTSSGEPKETKVCRNGTITESCPELSTEQEIIETHRSSTEDRSVIVERSYVASTCASSGVGAFYLSVSQMGCFPSSGTSGGFTLGSCNATHSIYRQCTDELCQSCQEANPLALSPCYPLQDGLFVQYSCVFLPRRTSTGPPTVTGSPMSTSPQQPPAPSTPVPGAVPTASSPTPRPATNAPVASNAPKASTGVSYHASKRLLASAVVLSLTALFLAA